MNTTMTTTTAKRLRRDPSGLLHMSYDDQQELNELSHTVLRSIEAALVADLDFGNCIRRILCESNRYSTETKDARKIWLPVWR